MENLSTTKLKERTKYKIVVRTFLSANKGKKYTARQINDFIIENKLCSSKSLIHYNALIRLVKEDKRMNGILSNVEFEKKHLYYFWIEKGV